MIDSPTGIVLLGSNRNRVASMDRGRCSYCRLTDMSAPIGASIGVILPVHHSYSTYGQLVAGLGQLRSSEHSDSQQ
jgi:hypothetical protein